MEKPKIVDREITLYFDNGFKVVIEYKIDEDVDDYIYAEVRDCWEHRKFLWLNVTYVDCEIKINGEDVDELDMRRVIGMNN